MTTPIIMLVIMTSPYFLIRLCQTFSIAMFNLRDAAAIGLGLLFIFTGVGHFVQTDAMVQMLPSWVPQRLFLVHATGILEFVIALGFFIRKFRKSAGLVAAAVLVLFFPANIYAAFHYVPFGGHAWGPIYLLIRAPLQFAILLWIFLHTIKGNDGQSALHKAAVV